MSKNLLRKISSIFSSPKFKNIDIPAIERILGYKFRDRNLIITAFTHSSSLSSTKKISYQSNERLEFLGDAVLDLVVTEFLYRKMPFTPEGALSKMKSVLVSRSVLAEVVSHMELGRFLILNRGEEKTGGRVRPSNLANLYESVLGAIYLDGNLKNACQFIENTLLTRHEQVLNNKSFINYKSLLLEHAQSMGEGSPDYHMIDESGPDHEKKFKMNVSIDGKEKAQGTGKSKKFAEQAAAHNLLKKVAPELLSTSKNE
jgi:ribonuclease-3